MYLQMRKTRYPKTLLHCTTLGFSPVESYNRLQKRFMLDSCTDIFTMLEIKIFNIFNTAG